MIDIRQTPQYAKHLKKTGWIVERHAEINYFIKKFPVIGSTIKIQRPQKIRIKKTVDLAKKYRAFQIIYEPKNDLDAKYLQSCDYKLSKSPYLPSKTLHIDLTKSKDKILKQMKKDARHSIKRTKNLKTQELKNEKNIEEFRNSWIKSVGLKRYVPSIASLKALKVSFKERSLFLLAFNNEAGVPAKALASAGAIFLIGDKTAYYWQAFTSKKGRKTLAQYRLVWKGILWAKREKAKILDFEGIYDARFPNKRWLGFTHFKKSFGGYVVEYPGAYTKFFLFDTILKR